MTASSMFTAKLRARFGGLNLFRPRTVARLVKSAEEGRQELRELLRTVKALQEQVAAAKRGQEQIVQRLQADLAASSEETGRRHAALLAEVRAIAARVADTDRREQQLRAIAQADTDLETRERELDGILQPTAIAAHAASAIAAATLHEDPFPYVVVDHLLPDDCYDALVRGLPPVELFSDRPVNKQQLKVPLRLAPRYSRRVWSFMAEVAAPEAIAPAIVAKFAAPARAWLKANFPEAGDDPLDDIALSCSDGRIMLRRPGYYIPPHRDPKWGFLTCLFYLARPGDDERWGTELFRVDEDGDARGAQPHWIAEDRCHAVERVAFRRNRALIFLNSTGAHGSRIPEDAQPRDLERYAYQFRVGAGRQSIEQLLAGLSPERRALWEGKAGPSY